ncbi:thiol reductant ABC exporter subunit CydD [Rhizobium tubonense]|uniref:Thiol reductant ABC exporter subunit CydD n=1 Tax=Rhizobium tubonense TaxID=484088 RepID=A0A2W4C706_9HYPH|nr:thiol reductant ABC exporter subunit CydD [Rhizobium tubonense]PZM08781.1 thiol reductant ABC exporter subunit CydD [Rhizobium tubonense]
MTSAFLEAAVEPADLPTRNPQASAEPALARDRNTPRLRPNGLPRAAMVQTVAALIWIPQAALLAFGVGTIASGGGGLAEVALPAAFVLALGVARAALDATGGRMAFRAARAELTRRRDIATTALAARSPLDVERPASGFAASLIAEQAETMVPYFARFLPARLKASTVPLVTLVCVFPISWVAAIILILAAPLIPIFMALIGWRAKAASEEMLAKSGGLNAFLLDRLRGLATIRALGAVDITAQRLRADAESLRRRTMAVLKIAFLSSAVLEFFAALGVAATAVYIGFSLLGSIDIGSWNGKLTLTQGLFILLLAPAFFEPLRELSAAWHDRASGQAAIDALDGLSHNGLVLPGWRNDQVGASDDFAAVPDIRIRDFSFRHAPAQSSVFKDFNLTVAAGEHVALLGPSGCGKTTLLSLIAGLAPHENGTIHIAGELMSDRSSAALRRRITWIGQRPHVFAGTMGSNITLGRPDVGADAIRCAIRKSHLQPVFETHGAALIGEGGAGLSGGEAMRLMLARAVVENQAGIILADEPTAHLDAETANDIARDLMLFAHGRTLVIATHDPVLAARMDRVIRLGAPEQELAG